MPDRAAIVTGASRGIGLALAETLGEEGFGLTITARKPETLQQAASQLRDRGFEVEDVVANLNDEDGVREVVERHRERYGRLDVLVNSAGVGIGAPASEHQTKHIALLRPQRHADPHFPRPLRHHKRHHACDSHRG